MRASVPANLLLLGEYAVLEEGGLGLAVAVDPRVRISAAHGRPGASLEVAARMDTALRWTPREPRGNPRTALLAAAVEVCCPEGPPAGTIEVDSSDFFFGGRKGGLGSSAAAAVGLCWALLALAAGDPPEPAAVLEAALAAHRRAQGGRGSGYDVFASFYGGAGLFAGGARPSWQPLDLPWLEPLYLFHGERSLSTPGAIGKYREWRLRRPGEAGSFLEESNRLVRSFSRAASRGEALISLRLCRELGLRLGEAIGVPADMRPPGNWDGIRAEDCKALGAGNELGLAFPELRPELPPELPPDGLPGSLWAAGLSARGLAQESPE
jgi:phosphomevalonate kinase